MSRPKLIELTYNTADKDLTLDTREVHFLLYDFTRIRTHANVVSKVTTVERGAENKDPNGFGNHNGRSISNVAVVLAFVGMWGRHYSLFLFSLSLLSRCINVMLFAIQKIDRLNANESGSSILRAMFVEEQPLM